MDRPVTSLCLPGDRIPNTFVLPDVCTLLGNDYSLRVDDDAIYLVYGSEDVVAKFAEMICEGQFVWRLARQIRAHGHRRAWVGDVLRRSVR